MNSIKFAIKVFEERYGKEFLYRYGNQKVRTLFYSILRERYALTDLEIADYFGKNRCQLTAERNSIYALMRTDPALATEYQTLKALIAEEETLPVWITEE